ncbi:hypothetical protein CHS0354_009821, partial [Potamilus streckersoni]
MICLHTLLYSVNVTSDSVENAGKKVQEAIRDPDPIPEQNTVVNTPKENMTVEWE